MAPAIEKADRLSYRQSVLRQIMDTLEPLRACFGDSAITDIMVNGPDNVFVLKAGKPQQFTTSLSTGQIRSAITLLAAFVEREVGKESGRLLLSARLPGYRIEAVLPPAAIKGPTMCIRRHATRVVPFDEYVASGVLSRNHADHIRAAVDTRQTVLIAGGTGSGKTTFMNAVLALVNPVQRLFVIETIHELRIENPNAVLVECDEEIGVTARAAVRTALRYAPDRIVLGELRGQEAFDWLDGANTGHPGSFATLHANSAQATLGRLERLVLMADMGLPYVSVQAGIAEAVQMVVYMERRGDQRRVSQVMRIHGFDTAAVRYETESIPT